MASDALTSDISAGERLPWLRLLRPHHWVKNLLLFVPIALNRGAHRPGDWGEAGLAFIAFGLCASAGYVLNDWRDLESDRQHADRRHRPLASGAVSPGRALMLAGAMVVAAFILTTLMLPWTVSALLATYLAISAAYSLWLKRRVLLDVFVLAGLYTLRLVAGGAVISIQLTPWLLAFSMFFFLSLAFAKRYAELSRSEGGKDDYLRSRGYRREDMAIILSVGPASGYLAVLVLALYVSSDQAGRTFRRPEILWLLCPVLLYWITRIWFVASRGRLNHDPLIYALTDRISWAAGGVFAGLAILAAMG